VTGLCKFTNLTEYVTYYRMHTYARGINAVSLSPSVVLINKS